MGRPIIHVTRERLNELLALNLSHTQIAKVLGICRTSLYKKMAEYGIDHKERYSAMSDDHLDSTIQQIYRNQHKMGEVMLMGHLRARGYNVQRKRLREAIDRVDPEGVKERKANAIKRRVYSVMLKVKGHIREAARFIITERIAMSSSKTFYFAKKWGMPLPPPFPSGCVGPVLGENLLCENANEKSFNVLQWSQC